MEIPSTFEIKSKIIIEKPRNLNRKPIINKAEAFPTVFDDICCGTPNILEKDGFQVCNNCGTAYDRVFISRQRRAFHHLELEKRKMHERKNSEFGPRTTLPGKRDHNGKMIKGPSKYNRIEKINKSIHSSYERNLWFASTDFQKLEERLQIPSYIMEDAKKIYRTAVKNKLTIGRDIISFVCASLYCALRYNKIPYNIEEIIEIFIVKRKKVFKRLRTLQLEVLPKLGIKIENAKPEEYLDRYIEELNLSMKVRNFAAKIIKVSRNAGYTMDGNNTRGVIGSIIYLASRHEDEWCKQKEIAEVVKVTEVTLRNQVKKIREYIKSIRS